MSSKPAASPVLVNLIPKVLVINLKELDILDLNIGHKGVDSILKLCTLEDKRFWLIGEKLRKFLGFSKRCHG